MMQLGVDGVFVGSGIFKSNNPAKRAEAIVQAVVHYDDAKVLAEISEDIGEPMVSAPKDTNVTLYIVSSENKYFCKFYPQIFKC